MNADQFKTLRTQACALYKAQPAADKQKISLDAIFTALAVQSLGEPASRRRTTDEGPPDWFSDTLAKLKGTGEKVTVSRFMLLAGKFPATRPDALNVGRWLREAGYVPTKTGGNLLFEM